MSPISNVSAGTAGSFSKQLIGRAPLEDGLSKSDLSSGHPRPANGSAESNSVAFVHSDPLLRKAVPNIAAKTGVKKWGLLLAANPHPSSCPTSPLSRTPVHDGSPGLPRSRVSRVNADRVVEVSSAVGEVVPALERLLSEAALTPEQRKDVEFSLQAILSGTLYKPTVKVPAARSFADADRRNTTNGSSFHSEVKVDDEAYQWLAHAYQLDHYTVSNKAFTPTSRPKASILQKLERSGSLHNSHSPWLDRLVPHEKTAQPNGAETEAEKSAILAEPSQPRTSEAEKQVAAVLLKLHDREFDVFELAAVNGGAALKCVASAIFNDLDLYEKLGIDKQVLDAFLTAIETGYQQVPYHNDRHAADVLHSCYLLICRGSLHEWMTDEEVFSLLIAAIIHDYRHPGLSNAFLITSRDHLATLYNDRAVLENHHLASAFVEMYKEGQNIMKHFPIEQQRAIRTRIIQLVLITDMSEHFGFVGKFRSEILGPGFSLDQNEHRISILQMALKCADLNSTAKPQKLAIEWSERVMNEFFEQGEREKEMGLPVSPMCDKEAANLPMQQLRFIEYIVQPLYENFAEHCPALDDWLQVI